MAIAFPTMCKTTLDNPRDGIPARPVNAVRDGVEGQARNPLLRLGPKNFLRQSLEVSDPPGSVCALDTLTFRA